MSIEFLQWEWYKWLSNPSNRKLHHLPREQLNGCRFFCVYSCSWSTCSGITCGRSKGSLPHYILMGHLLHPHQNSYLHAPCLVGCWTSNPDIDDIYKGEFLFLNTQEWSYCYHRHYAHNGVSMQCPYVHPFSLQFEQLAMFKHCSLHVIFAISWHHRLWHREEDNSNSHKCSHLPALDKILLLHPLLCTYSYGAHFVWLLKVHVEVKHTG